MNILMETCSDLIYCRRRGGDVSCACLLIVCVEDNTKTSEWIFMKLAEGVKHEPGKKPIQSWSRSKSGADEKFVSISATSWFLYLRT